MSKISEKAIQRIAALLWIVGAGCAAAGAQAGQSQEPVRQERAAPGEPSGDSNEPDPFADLAPASKAPEPAAAPALSWKEALFHENFGFRKEVMLQFDIDQNGRGASRQSAGFEVLKKFSTATSTVASFDFQGRLVRRDGFNPVLNDMEGENRRGWAFEFHNVYLDFYNVLNPLLGGEQRGKQAGRFNFRAGRFYVPFGLNLQTDTHGTVFQLSNEQNFGFERDWYAGFWGRLNGHLNYDAYYLAGSGYKPTYKGQSGLGALRLSLANRYSSQYGIEGGLSFLAGERLSLEGAGHAATTSPAASKYTAIDTRRAGIDGRYRRAVPGGLLTFTNELSGGRDASTRVFVQLHEAGYLRSSRRWGVAAQFRRLQRGGIGDESSLIGEISWYFRNDVGNSNLHWIKLNVERKLVQIPMAPGTVVTLQYYFFQ